MRPLRINSIGGPNSGWGQQVLAPGRREPDGIRLEALCQVL